MKIPAGLNAKSGSICAGADETNSTKTYCHRNPFPVPRVCTASNGDFKGHKIFTVDGIIRLQPFLMAHSPQIKCSAHGGVFLARYMAKLPSHPCMVYGCG
jgi:hypothetical protein